MKSPKFNKSVLFSLGLNLISTSWCKSADFEYFNSEIDYWNKKETKTQEVKQPIASKEKQVQNDSLDTESKFSWGKYLDPKNKEFFKEGDYTPPEPFMEIARNPTDANLKLWFSYIEKKNELSTKLQERMKDYLAKNSGVAPETSQVLQARAAVLPKATEDAKRYRFRMYFDSHCPHCKRMFGTLTELQSKGFQVEAVQVDNDVAATREFPIPSRPATREELARREIKSVPLLLVGDLKNKSVYPLAGYHSYSDVFRALAQAPGGKEN